MVSTIEQMVSNIQSVTKTVKDNVDSIEKLNASADSGNQAVSTAHTIAKNITDDSEGLLEASNVIQHIASQTNLVEISRMIDRGMNGIGSDTGQINEIVTKVSEISETNTETVSKVMKYLSQLSI